MHFSEMDPDRPGLDVFAAHGDTTSKIGIPIYCLGMTWRNVCYNVPEHQTMTGGAKNAQRTDRILALPDAL